MKIGHDRDQDLEPRFPDSSLFSYLSVKNKKIFTRVVNDVTIKIDTIHLRWFRVEDNEAVTYVITVSCNW